jgi:nucleotide-binding universal stress UspA family protein
MIKYILIPSDGSDYGKTAVAYGIYLAKKLDARIMGLHVVDIRLLQPPLITDISGTMSLPLYHGLTPSLENSLDEKAEAVLKDFREKCNTAGLQPVLKKAFGVIEEKIIEEAKSADLIILAKSGEHLRFGEAMLGSTAESVLQAAGKPVMVTPPDFRPIVNMALAYDGSPPAEKALKLAAELASQTSWPLRTIIITDNRQAAADFSDKVASHLSPFNIASEITLLSGKEDRQLIHFIMEGSVQLMIMGSYGHNKLRRMLLGSTTSYVIHKSTIPVLLTH